MHHLVYLSQATAPFGLTQRARLLERVRHYNSQHGLTGVLLYGNEQFFQVLEGEAAAVQAAYVRICQDPRHRDITVFANQPIARRIFTNWSMADAALPPQQFIEFVDYVTAAGLPPAAHSHPSDAQLWQLLRTFTLAGR